MSLPWVKLHVPLLNNRDYKHLSPGAKLTFVTSLMLAGDLDKGDYSGRLESASGPVGIDELASHTGMKPKLQAEAVTELLKIGFLEQDMLGTLSVARFGEKAGLESQRSSAAERQRKFRERHRNDSNVTGVTPRNVTTVTDKEEDKELYASLRSAAISSYAVFPEDDQGVQGLALIFLHRFANCSDPVKAKRHIGAYASVLDRMRKRGATVAQAWEAFDRSWRLNGEVPLHGGLANRALDSLPGRVASKYGPGKVRAALEGFEGLD